MRYLHVRNLEKYQDGYKDRRHIWAKVHIDMIIGDEQCEALNEVDWGRLVRFIVLETCYGKKTPLDTNFLRRRGFDFKKRSLEDTLTQIAHFIDVTEDDGLRNEIVTKPSPRIEESREEKNREDEREKHGSHGLVLLTRLECQKLYKTMGERKAAEYIQKLELYIGSKGAKYVSHYMTILQWWNKDGKPKDPVRHEESQAQLDKWRKEAVPPPAESVEALKKIGVNIGGAK